MRRARAVRVPPSNETSASYSLSPWPSGSRGEALASAPRLRFGDGAGSATRHLDNFGLVTRRARRQHVPNHLDPGFEFRVAHAFEAAAMRHLKFARNQQNQKRKE